MTTQELATRRRRAEEETFVISEIEEGFRLYAPADPTRSYVVSGTPDEPTCTCPDFQVHGSDPEWCCKHILAVLPRIRVVPTEKATDEAEERAAIQAEGAPPRTRRASRPTNGLAQMVLKRSVSPDGRIDSLSVEISTPIEKLEAEEIRSSAVKALAIQDGIVKGFRNGNGSRTEDVPAAEDDANGAVPARMIGIGGMNGRWGRRLFITVEVDGRRLRLFGSKTQLAEAIAATGLPERAPSITEGVKMAIPCRVVTEPTEDGKYLDITKVLPLVQTQPAERIRA